MSHLPPKLHQYLKRSGGRMVVPVCERVTTLEEVLVDLFEVFIL